MPNSHRDKTVDTDGEEIFSGECNTYLVRCRGTESTSESANPVEVHVTGLHDDGEYAVIPPGREMAFRVGSLGRRTGQNTVVAIAAVTARGVGGDAKIDAFPIAAEI